MKVIWNKLHFSIFFCKSHNKVLFAYRTLKYAHWMKSFDYPCQFLIKIKSKVVYKCFLLKDRQSRMKWTILQIFFLSFSCIVHVHCPYMIPLVFEVHCNGNSVYVFLFWELRGLSPNFHIHVFVSDLYIPRIGPHIFPPAEKADPSWEYIIRSQTHECGNWDWGPDIPLLGIFVSIFRHFVFAACRARFNLNSEQRTHWKLS